MTPEDIDREIASLDDEVRRLLEKRERLANMYRLPKGPRPLTEPDIGEGGEARPPSPQQPSSAKPSPKALTSLTDTQKNHLSLIAQGIIGEATREGYCRYCRRPCPGTLCDRCQELRSGRL